MAGAWGRPRRCAGATKVLCYAAAMTVVLAFGLGAVIAAAAYVCLTWAAPTPTPADVTEPGAVPPADGPEP
jgi:hypothetical protein